MTTGNIYYKDLTNNTIATAEDIGISDELTDMELREKNLERVMATSHLIKTAGPRIGEKFLWTPALASRKDMSPFHIVEVEKVEVKATVKEVPALVLKPSTKAKVRKKIPAKPKPAAKDSPTEISPIANPTEG